MNQNRTLNTYQRLLRDPRWQKKRLAILNSANWHCQDAGCDSPDEIPLEVHHCYYLYGKKPWDYPDDAFLALCEPCHRERQKLENELKLNLLKRLRPVPIRRMAKLFWSWLDEALKEETR
jgi:5-methylcytosine-specific restriction endonuclease McrA